MVPILIEEGALGEDVGVPVSAQSYIVVPADSPEDAVGRLETSGTVFGIGPILFDARDPQKPSFDIRTLTARLCSGPGHADPSEKQETEVHRKFWIEPSGT